MRRQSKSEFLAQLGSSLIAGIAKDGFIAASLRDEGKEVYFHDPGEVLFLRMAPPKPEGDDVWLSSAQRQLKDVETAQLLAGVAARSLFLVGYVIVGLLPDCSDLKFFSPEEACFRDPEFAEICTEDDIIRDLAGRGWNNQAIVAFIKKRRNHEPAGDR